MPPDREAALRDFLTAIRDHLDVPIAVHADDVHKQHQLLAARAGDVRVLLGQLISGPLDNTAVQSHGRVLGDIRRPPRYDGLPPRGES